MTSSKTDREREERERIKELARKGRLVTRGSGKIPEDFWTMPRPADPEGLLLKVLLEDRREGR